MSLPLGPALVSRLHAAARADRWGVTVERFGEALTASASHALAGRALSDRDVESWLGTLKLEDLALATACADGDSRAWEHFVREIRPILYRAADALDSSGGARDLADALYGELFGAREVDGHRQSLFRYFHGRSSLATWVRSVLAQRFVDRVRARRRTSDLPDDDAPGALPAPQPDSSPERRRLAAVVHAVLLAAVAGLAPRDRLRLACYYGQNMKLAAIGRMLNEHEATVSRHLTRTRAELRSTVEQRLRADYHLAPAALAEYLDAAANEPGTLDLAAAFGPSSDDGRKEDDAGHSKEGRRRVEGA